MEFTFNTRDTRASPHRPPIAPTQPGVVVSPLASRKILLLRDCASRAPKMRGRKGISGNFFSG